MGFPGIFPAHIDSHIIVATTQMCRARAEMKASGYQISKVWNGSRRKHRHAKNRRSHALHWRGLCLLLLKRCTVVLNRSGGRLGSPGSSVRVDQLRSLLAFNERLDRRFRVVLSISLQSVTKLFSGLLPRKHSCMCRGLPCLCRLCLLFQC